MTNHAPALDTCRKLEAVGFPQHTIATWIIRGKNSMLTTDPKDVMRAFVEQLDCIAAPLLTEVLEQLPKNTQIHFDDGWEVFIPDEMDPTAATHMGSDQRLVEAAALLWLGLHQ